MSERGIFRLVPSADPGDPRWLGRKCPGEVLVRADSAADARIVAAMAEMDFPETNAKPSHGVTTRFASCFRDEKLYEVVAATSTEFPPAGPREVLSGLSEDDIHVLSIKEG
ncbi:MAG: hypothetical protein APF80_08380 [Alphaproteobacteria bacterium BRH_c36]|nr:MAG: hypothetical protein APF80_08380 [Alphaproteobacteria bacterium BRH_c36]